MRTVPRSGFTIIEVLFVIAVMALVAAILFPVFSQGGIQARRKVGEKNIRKISLGILQYLQDNDGKFPRTGYDCRGHNGSSPDDATSFAPGEHNQCGGDAWQDAIGPYVKDPAVFLAPGDKSAVGEGPWGGGTGTNLNTTDGNLSYLYNDLLSHRMPTNSTGYGDPSRLEPRSNGLRLSEIKNPSECLMLAEGHGGWDKAGTPDDPTAVVATDWTGSTDLQNKWHHEYGVNVNFTAFMSPMGYDGTPIIRIDMPFNTDGGNVSFADGHSKFAVYSTLNGRPALCQSLPWPKTVDPQQRGADKNSCNDPNNPLPAGWTNPNWF